MPKKERLPTGKMLGKPLVDYMDVYPDTSGASYLLSNFSKNNYNKINSDDATKLLYSFLDTTLFNALVDSLNERYDNPVFYKANGIPSYPGGTIEKMDLPGVIAGRTLASFTERDNSQKLESWRVRVKGKMDKYGSDMIPSAVTHELSHVLSMPFLQRYGSDELYYSYLASPPENFARIYAHSIVNKKRNPNLSIGELLSEAINKEGVFDTLTKGEIENKHNRISAINEMREINTAYEEWLKRKGKTLGTATPNDYKDFLVNYWWKRTE